MRRTSARLADDREIIYFDRDTAEVRDVPDRRPMSATVNTAELRWDRLLDESVAIASHRQDRTYLPPADECPLCPSRDGRVTEIPSPDYDVVVFENRFPAFTERAPGGRGRCEVVCFTSDHDRSFRELTRDRVRTVVDVWADRTEQDLAVRAALEAGRARCPDDRRRVRRQRDRAGRRSARTEVAGAVTVAFAGPGLPKPTCTAVHPCAGARPVTI